MNLFKQHNKAALDHDFNLTVPTFVRNKWPKVVAALSPRQEILADDFLKHWHQVLPQKYGAIENFNHHYPLKILPQKKHFSTLEIGAGIGGHLTYEELQNQTYHCVELRSNMAEAIKEKYPTVHTWVGDCQNKLPFENDSIDRVIAIHVLEHLPNLPKAIEETHRVLTREGIFSVVIPCDPGFLYEVARKISAERIFKKRYKMPYRWFIRREHINCPEEIKNQIAASFRIIDISYFPLGIPLNNLNLCMGITALKR